jgi:hypothetical protein
MIAAVISTSCFGLVLFRATTPPFIAAQLHLQPRFSLILIIIQKHERQNLSFARAKPRATEQFADYTFVFR